MNSLAEFGSVLWLTAALSFFLYSSRQKRREKGMMEALRRSALYLRLYRKLDHLFHHYEIDQLRVEQNGVTVTSVMPAHTLLTFDFKQNGNSKRACDASRLVMQLLYEDFPLLASRDIYKMTRYCVYRSNGKKEYGFSFTMRRGYKERLLRERMAARVRIY